MRQIVLVAHNVRSSHNVGSLLRTADGLGVERVYLSGYTPYPKSENDSRLPHIASKTDSKISKTSLGAEKSVDWKHVDDITTLIDDLKDNGFYISALEQTASAIPLQNFSPPEKIALIIGREVDGIEPEILKASDNQLVIPMFGKKESFNVVQAAAMALFHIRFA